MKDIDKYFNNIKKLFPVHGKKEKEFLNNIKLELTDYDNFTYQELEEQFGTPIDIVKSYYDSVDSNYLLRRIDQKRMLIFTCMLVLLLSFSYTLYRTYTLRQAYLEFQEQFPITYEENIEETGE